MSRKLIGLIVACLLASPLAAQSYMLAGQDKTLWMLRRADDSFDLLARNPEGKWQWISRGNTGQPVAVTAEGGMLHVFFTAGEHRVYTLQLPGGTFAPAFDGNVIAACAADEGMIALAWQPMTASGQSSEPATGSQPAADRTLPPTSLASAPATSALTLSRPTQLVRLRALMSDGSKWRVIGTMEDFAYSEDVKVYAAFQQGKLHVLVHRRGEQNRLLMLEGDRWRELQLPPQKEGAGDLAGGDVVGLFSVAGRLVALVREELPAGTPQVRLAWTASADGEWTWETLCSQDKKPVAWPAGTTLTAGILEQRLAVVSQSPDQEVPQLAIFELDGVEVRSESMDVLKRYSSDEFAQEVLQYFLWAVLIAIFIPLFLVRPANPPKPFMLPEGVRPGALARRLVAAILDFIPFLALSSMAFPTPAMSPDEIRSLVQEQRLPENFVFAVVSTLSLYVIYCIVMEYRFAATLGKMAFRLRVVGDDGKRPTLREVVLRNLVKVVELIWPIGLPFLILLPLLSRNRQRLGDMLARTTVIDATSLPAKAPVEPKEPTHEEQDR